MNILEISDGTTTINLLSANYGFCLNSWNPQIAQAKRGGVYQSSSLSQGSKLVDRKLENIEDAFDFDVKGSGQPETILYITKLINLLEQATEYWTGHANKVWLKAKADCEDNPRYALIVNYSWPELKFPYGSTFFTATEIASMINVDMGIEHKPWQATIPGESDCAQASGVQTWKYEDTWSVNTAIPIGDVNSLLQTANGDIYAGDTGQILRSQNNGDAWAVNTVDPISSVRSLLQATNGDIYAGEDGRIWRSQDNGASWAVNTLLPTGNVFDMLQATNGSIYAVGNGGEIHRTQNDGASWVLIATVANTNLLSIIQSTAGTLITSGTNGQIYRSADGVTWTLANTVTSGAINALLKMPGGIILAGIDTPDEIWQSSDDGLTWTQVVSVSPSGVNDLIQAENGNIYTAGNDIWVSVDNGITWSIDTTLPTNAKSLLGTTNDDVFAGDNTQILRGRESTASMGRAVTCNNEVYIANKQNTANLTHIKIDDGGVFTDIFPIAAYPQILLPAVPALNDAIYFGINTGALEVEGGPFDNLVFDIDTLANGTSVTITYEYWNGAWVALTVYDATLSFTTRGNGVFWEQPSDWTPTAIDGVTAYWVRARVSAIGAGVLTPPTQQNRDIYTVVLSYANIASTEILGNIPALVRQKLQNQSDKDGRAGSAPNLWDNRIICGLREYNRGVNFQAYLNIADEQNPVGVTVTATGANCSFQADVTAPTGRSAQYNPAGVEAMATQVTIALGPSIARDFYGKFHAFLRVQRTAGAITDFDVQLQFVSGSGGIQFTTASKQIQTTTQFELLDFGQVKMPVGGTFKSTDLGDTTEIRVQASAASGTPNLNLYDLILIPVDEWSVDSVDFANSSDSIIGLDDDAPKFLDIDSITNPKIDIQTLVRLVGSEQITSVYDPVSPGFAVLQENKQQRLWFLAAQTSATGTSYSWISPPYITHSIQLFKSERYLTFSKGS